MNVIEDFASWALETEKFGEARCHDPAEFQLALHFCPDSVLVFLANTAGASRHLLLLGTVTEDHAMWPTRDFTCGGWNICHKYQRSTVSRLAFDATQLSLQVWHTLKLQNLQPVGKQLRKYLDTSLIDGSFDFCNSTK